MQDAAPGWEAWTKGLWGSEEPGRQLLSSGIQVEKEQSPGPWPPPRS